MNGSPTSIVEGFVFGERFEEDSGSGKDGSFIVAASDVVAVSVSVSFFFAFLFFSGDGFFTSK